MYRIFFKHYKNKITLSTSALYLSAYTI